MYKNFELSSVMQHGVVL